MKFSIACALAYFLATSPSLADEDWVDLTPNKDLAGWERKGGVAEYRIENGEVVGTSKPNTSNTFLCTKETFGDFVLEFEFLGHDRLNSGVQVRSQSLESYKNGRVHGYQVELEENGRDRDWSGGIYDEGRRGWLYPHDDADESLKKAFGEQGRRLWKPDEWNKVRVECKGSSIRTWLNGEERANLDDDMTPEGFIALQVHGVGDRKEPMEVRWRNIRIKELK